ncbi:helix-turn-helix domain-containing protein [Georgenia sp. Z1491]|uniref:helix-turn-helix domain-containing protein n=1 Tax=Georgenia sp. Z1491 TaxID=3416707 RepID=UPI003CF4FA50
MSPTHPPSHEPIDVGRDASSPEPVGLRDLLHGVAEISSAVNEPVSVPTLLNLVAETACRLMGFDFCGVFLPDRTKGVLVVEGSYGFSPRYITEVNALHPITIEEGTTQAPSTRAFLTQEPVQVLDTATDPAFAQWGEGAREQGFRSMIAVPLIVSGTTVGTLNGYTSRRQTFDEHVVELAGTLANQAAIAIASARLRTAQARTIQNLEQLNSSLEEQHTLAQQAEAIHQRLAQVALEQGGVEGVTLALSELLHRSVVVEEPGGREIARVVVDGQSLTAPPADDGPGDGRAEETSTGGELVDVDGPDGPLTILQVRLGGDVAAHVWLEGRSADLSRLERRAVDYAGTVLALELLRRRTAQEVEWRTSSDLVHELVRGGPTTPADLTSRAQRLDHDLDHPHVVLVARPDTASTAGESALLGAARSAASSVRPRPLVAAIGPYVVMLWPDDEESAIDAVADELRRTYRRIRGRSGTASVTVSSTCRSMHEYAGAFRLGRGMAELARVRRRRDGTIRLDDLGPMSLLLQIEDPAELVRYAERLLGPLRAHDERRGSSLVDTLSVYFAHDQNTAATARELHVHPNTVGLRVRRIEEILGLSLSGTDAVVHVGMALMADQVALTLDA